MFNNKVLICDSGIPLRYIKNATSIDIGLGILDENGHGSQIFEENRFFLDKFKFYSMKILDRHKTCNLEMFVRALDRILESDFDIVCFALAFEFEEFDDKICDYIEKKIDLITKKGTHIICSAHNSSSFSYPASFCNVKGIKVNRNQKSYISYNKESIIEFSIKDNGIICEALDDIYQPFTGNSRASSLLLCKILEYIYENNQYPSDYSQFAIWWNAQELNKIDSDLKHVEVDSEILSKVYGKVIECFGICKDDKIISHIDSVESLTKFIRALRDEGLYLGTNNKLYKSDLETIETLSRYFSKRGVENDKI